MRPQTKTLLILSLMLALLSIVTAVQASGNSQVRLSTKRDALQVGQETGVDILIEDAPIIYGADVQISFDPKILEVVDADEKQTGIQIDSGKFIDEKMSFFLLHDIDNRKGSIDYALTLLNPAPPVEGDGQLARITFRAKATGSTIISVTKGKFGTQTGETISPELAGIEITVGDKKGSEEKTISAPTIVGLTGAGIVGVGFIFRWLWRKHVGRI
jgi:hypothetical protein